jgi:hypothetical protein
MKHTIELIEIKARGNGKDKIAGHTSKTYFDIWSVKIDGIEMELVYFVYMVDNKPTQKFKFSSPVTKHPDYKEIRASLQEALCEAYRNCATEGKKLQTMYTTSPVITEDKT